MHDRRRDGIGAQGESADTGVVPVVGQLAHQPADQGARPVMQGGPAQVDVIVGFLARRQGHLAVHHRDIADQSRQLITLGRIESRS